MAAGLSAREKRRWLQGDFAYGANIDRSYMDGVERGKRNLSFKKLCAIAQTPECDLAVPTRGPTTVCGNGPAKTAMTEPNRISSPSFSLASVIETRLTCVPFVECKSVSQYESAALTSLAWWADTVGSSMIMWFNGARPIMTMSGSNSCVPRSTPSRFRMSRAILS